MTHSKTNQFAIAPQSRFYHGPFGRICPDLPAWAPEGIPDHQLEDFFLDFATEHMVEAPGVDPIDIANDDTLRNSLDADFDSKIPAAYTYFGQFVDHDITFDITALSDSQVDPNKLRNFRTPRLDLDCVYGSGPADQPYLYEHEDGKFTGRMIVGATGCSSFPDLLRNSEGRAIIGDMRNDENAIVAQIQLAFILAHNTLVDRCKDANPGISGGEAFEKAQKVVRWLYQWIVWNDFVRRIAVDEVYECALHLDENQCGGISTWELGLKTVYNWKHQPFMPVEFSVAAYRFGHSMARNSYQTNAGKSAGFGKFFPLFDLTTAAKNDLSGFRPLEVNRVLQWDWFLDMAGAVDPFPQKTRKIDTKLSNALAKLRENPDVPGSIENMLAARNLVRSVRMKLPSGPDVACKYGLEPVALDEHEPHALWFYILKEASALPGANKGQMLGRLGSAIVCATIAGLLKGDGLAFINVNPKWTPDDEPLLTSEDNQDPGDWSLASIIRLSGLPVDASAF